MGANIDKIKPSSKVNVQGLDVHVAEPAYKPYFFSTYSESADNENKRMAVSSGAVGCNMAWAKKSERPKLVATYPGPFGQWEHGQTLRVVKYPERLEAGWFNEYDLDEYAEDVGGADQFQDSDWEDYPEHGFPVAA